MATQALLEEVVKLQRQVSTLLQQELFESAELLCGFIVCKTRTQAEQLPPTGPGSHSDSLELYADALYGKGEHRRALTYYRQAETYRKLGSEVVVRNGRPGSVVEALCDVDIKYKECKCFLKLHEPSSALRVLASVPARHRDLKVQSTLGSIYRQLGMKKDAISAYKNAVRQNPLALDGVLALAQLGVSQSDLWDLIVRSASGEGTPSAAALLPQPVNLQEYPWLESFVAAHTAAHAEQVSEGIRRFEELAAQFRGNTHCLLHKARLQTETNFPHEAQATFAEAREIDADLVEMMDYYAVLLRQNAMAPELNQLAQTLMSIDTHRPEPWLAVAFHSDLRGEQDRALAFADKALQMKPDHVLAYHLKGTVLLGMDRPDAALKAFQHASNLVKDIYSYNGLVESYVALRKSKEAKAVAKEAICQLPKNAKAYTLCGRVWSQLSGGAETALRCYKKALSLDPMNLDAILGLADIHIATRQYHRCVELLQRSLLQSNHDILHAKLGDAYTRMGMHQEALASLHMALSINPNCEAATIGGERLEKVMRGEDPDAQDAVAMDAGNEDL